MDTLPSILLKSGIITNEITVYKTVEQPTFVEKEYDGILFYSPSGVSSYFSMNTVSSGTVLFAIGHTTAAAIKLETNNEVVVCPTPSKEALLDEAILYFNNKR
jgi:uroporphyrinogen-III synthase